MLSCCVCMGAYVLCVHGCVCVVQLLTCHATNFHFPPPQTECMVRLEVAVYDCALEQCYRNRTTIFP